MFKQARPRNPNHLPPADQTDGGDAHRQREAVRRRKLSAAAAEIGPPPARDPTLYNRYRFDLFAFLQDRFPHSTGLRPFSEAHRRVITRLQNAILEGGLQLNVLFRGFAKSTIAENTAVWATGYGHRTFFVPIGADHEAARLALDSIQHEFETNDLLIPLFPEVCHCARALEGVAQRAGKQTINGTFTRIQWTSGHCVLPTVADFPGSGAIILPKGITANIRGLRFKRPDGTQARPDFVLVDDPQTDESAASPSQVQKRLDKLQKTILRLGGHDKPIACVVNATVIEPDDLVDQLSDPKNFPAWQTTRLPMLQSLADRHDDLWLGKYADLRGSYDPDDDDDQARAHRTATQLYAEHRDQMDAGAVATWSECYDRANELSAIQHAYNILIDTGEDAFAAECQSNPRRNTGGLGMLTPDDITRKQSGYQRGTFPADVTTLTAFVDVHPSILYWHVWAWSPNFTGYLVDYGTFPDQRRRYFAHSGISRRLERLFPNRDLDATVDAALVALLEGHEAEAWPGLMRREFTSAADVPFKIALACIDANGEAADAIRAYIRRSEFSALLRPTFGKGISAKQKPISRWHEKKKKAPGEWTLTKPKPGQPAGVIFDTNFYKTRFHRALALPPASQSALYLYQADPRDHRRLADAWHAEEPVEVIVGSRAVYEWKQKPNTDNHDLDCAVGAMVAASIAGISTLREPAPKKEPISLAQRQAKR